MHGLFCNAKLYRLPYDFLMFALIEKLKAEVAEKDSLIAKLKKEKMYLQESSPAQQKQSIKETNTIGLQFNYLIPSMGKSIIVCVSQTLLFK